MNVVEIPPAGLKSKILAQLHKATAALQSAKISEEMSRTAQGNAESSRIEAETALARIEEILSGGPRT